MIHKKDSYQKIISQLDLPFLETPQDDIEKIFEILSSKFGLRKDSRQKFIDLGAGNGTVIIFCALNYLIESVGIEIDPNLIKEMKGKIKKLKEQKNINRNVLKKIKIRLGDLFLINLKKYDFIYLYSLPTMQKYLQHLLKTAKVGAIIISYRYPLDMFNLDMKYVYQLIRKNKDQERYSYFYSML